MIAQDTGGVVGRLREAEIDRIAIAAVDKLLSKFVFVGRVQRGDLLEAARFGAREVLDTLEPKSDSRPVVEALAQRKAVNTILAELIAAYEPDIVKRIEIGNEACSLILAALTQPASDAGMREAVIWECAEVARNYNNAHRHGPALTHDRHRRDIADAILARLERPHRICQTDAVLAEMIAVATADEESDLAEEWPLDCRTQVDLWQSKLQPALGHPNGFRQPPAASDAGEMRRALERIASCRSNYTGDVVDIARAALSQTNSRGEA